MAALGKPLSIQQGDVSVYVRGLRKTIRALDEAGADMQDMRELMHDLGLIVVRNARVPSDDGRLRATLRAGRGKTKAVVRVGGARAPYAGVVHYGDPHRGHHANPFLTEAVTRSRSEVIRTFEAGLARILKKNNLK